MLQVLALVVPLALVGAVSPMMLTEQTVLLAGRGGRRTAGWYAGGVMATLLLVTSVLVAFGRSIQLPQEPQLSAGLDIVLGAALLVVATALHLHTPRPRREKVRRTALSPAAALGFGVVSMATNLTTLAVLVPAAKEVAASHLDPLGRATVILVVVAIAALPAWLPLALTVVAPGPADRALAALAGFIRRRGALVTVLLVAALGLLLVGRGVLHLAGG